MNSCQVNLHYYANLSQIIVALCNFAAQQDIMNMGSSPLLAASSILDKTIREFI